MKKIYNRDLSSQVFQLRRAETRSILSVCPKTLVLLRKICRNVYGPRYILQALTGCHAIKLDGHHPGSKRTTSECVCVWLRDQRGCAENISGLVSGWLDRSQREDTTNYVLRFMTMSQNPGFKGFFQPQRS